jgi:hypothetical protein
LVLFIHTLNTSVMENYQEKDRKVVKDATVTDTTQETPRNEENIEKNSSSKVTTNFQKKHGRTNHSLGDGHEPGTLPGSGV